MYLIDGINLDNAGRGWTLLGASEPMASHTLERPSLAGARQDGVTRGLGFRMTPPNLTFVVETRRADVGILRQLFFYGQWLTFELLPGKRVEFETISATPVGFGDADELLELTFVVRLPGVFWRDIADDTWTASLPSNANPNTATLRVMAGLGGPVRDAVIRIKGAVNYPKVADSNGSSFYYDGQLAATEYLRFDSRTGRAYLTTSDVWTGGAEVTRLISYGAGPYPFEIYPTVNGAINQFDGLLTITNQGSSSTGSVAVRGRRAYAE